jgi:AraC-like DNA-binding protein
MNVFVKFDFRTACQQLLVEKLDLLGVPYTVVGFGEILFAGKLSPEKKAAFELSLGKYGIEIVEDQKSILVQKIKDVIIEMISAEEGEINVKSSVYLADKLKHSYGYLSNLFSEVTYTSIENFIIIQKIEYAKRLIIKSDMTLTEIAFKLSYSSVAHLSTQFKNTTGITPSAFQRIIEKRRALADENN